MKFVTVPRVLLKALIERAVDIPELRDIASVLNRHCVYDEACVAAERRDTVMYRNVTDE